MKKLAVLVLALLLIIPLPANAKPNSSVNLNKVNLNEKIRHLSVDKNQKSGAINVTSVLKSPLRPFSSNSFSKLPTSLNTLKANKITANDTASNDSPNNAISITTGKVYSDTITAAGQQKWYYFQTGTAAKLTAVLQTIQSADVDYDLHLFKLNEETMNLEEQLTSSYEAGKNEQLSRIAGAGIYFLCVNSASGFDADTPFYFLVNTSNQYDSQEPDDNIWQAHSYSGSFNTEHTIDNVYDMDWIKLDIEKEKTFNVNLRDAASVSATGYHLDVFDGNLNALGRLDSNTPYSVSFQPGVYWLRVTHDATELDPSQKYSLSFIDEASKATITNVLSDPNVSGYIDYGYGNKWRIEHYATFDGDLVDGAGAPISNANVQIKIIAIRNQQDFNAYGYTDANGHFSLKINDIQEASGEYTYETATRTHYYDIIPLLFYVNGIQVNCNENELYHFAYSIYHG